jgi:predicted aspartyl protease
MKWVFSLLIAAAFCAMPRPIDAQVYQPPSISAVELFARVDKAYGARALGAYHRVNRAVASDGVVTITDTYTKGHDFKSVVTSSGLQHAWGRFLGHDWIQDNNGFVRPSSNDAPPDPFLHSREHPDDPASGVKLLGISGLEPRKGLHQLRYFDAGTYLLTRMETTDYDGHTRVTAYSNYKRVGGQFTALTLMDSDDLSTRTTRTDLTTYESIPESQAIVDVPASKPLFDLAGRSSVTIPAKFVDGEIIISLEISGKPYDFTLDSGASSFLLDSATARNLNLAVVAPHRDSFGGDFTVGTARVPDVSIGDLHAANVVMLVAPHATGHVLGLIGCDFFASGALVVDNGNETVTLMATAPDDPAAAGWNSIPIALDSCQPRINTEFDGTPGNFIVDLGGFYTVLSKHYFERLSIPGTSTTTAKAVFIGGASVDLHGYVIDKMEFGDSTFENVRVLVPTSTVVDTRTSDGMIGRNFLRHFDLLFDYAHRKLYFKLVPGDVHH